MLDLGGFTPGKLAGKAVTFSGALGAVVACAGTAVVAAAFAIYALLRMVLPPAGAAAVIVGVMALTAGIAGFIAYSQVVPPRRPASRMPPPPPETFAEQAMRTVRERPIIAAGAALAMGLVALRNPLLIATLMKALTDRPRDPRYPPK